MDPRRRKKLMERAVAAYGTIRPCEGRPLAECFTVQHGLHMFWFNDESGNTHAIVDRVPARPRARVAAAS